ncbi:MAG: type 3 domain protein [Pseudonocardia sp.]|nr:type 3 domain protein [Pseudonocardia sp.]
MRRRSPFAVVLAAVTGLTLAPTFSAASAAENSAFSPDLHAGESSGVTTQDGVVRLDPTAEPAPLDPSTSQLPPPRMGMLTLAPQRLAGPAAVVRPEISAEQPPDTSAVVDVRGRRADGAWSEWVPAETGQAATLYEPSAEIQLRLVLTGTAAAGPIVRGLRVTPAPADQFLLAKPPQPLVLQTHRIFATREGLVGHTTANGHVISENDHFVALPSRRALSPRDSQDYSVKVCAPTGKCAWAPVWDVGPWNTRDDYWNPPGVRQDWAQLPQGTPQSQAAYRDGFNGGLDQFGRKVANPAGIDLADGVFRDALGLTDNAYVTVDYLWTGRAALWQVVIANPLVEVRSAPRADAVVVGWAANKTAVAVECGTAGWLRIGPGQFLPGTAVPTAGRPTPCT